MRGLGVSSSTVDGVKGALVAIGVSSNSAIPLAQQLLARGVTFSSKADLARGLKNEKIVGPSYNVLDSMTSGVRQSESLEVHHLLEKRMVERTIGKFKVSVSEVDTKIPSIVLDKTKHQQITISLQNKIPYYGDSASYQALSKDYIIQSYRDVYSQHGLLNEFNTYIIPLFN